MRLDATAPQPLGDGAASDAALGDGTATIPALRLLSYNVAGLPEGISSSHPSVNSPLISPLLNAYSLALLQEDFSYHAQIISQASQPYRSPINTSGNSLGDGLSFLSDYPFTDFERVPWQACFGVVDSGSDCLTPKGFTFARLDVAKGISIDVYDVHTDAGSAPGDVSARAMNLAQLSTYIEGRSQGRAVIIAGDFNERYSAATRYIDTFVRNTSLSDAWVELIRAGEFPVGGMPVSCPGSDANDPTCERIDKVLYRNPGLGAGFTLQPRSYTVEGATFVDSSGAQLSDHRPVAVTFDFGGPPRRID
ncbi:MAG: Endonuclease/Exonuclease/phosphatase family protein [Myxococcaceae bacterium]|nr:Endonuclease/Exonuclease/phosphatase family protein [Myxococcaceae bacterium]